MIENRSNWRLAVDKPLRHILGWERRAQVPSEATFSRAFAEFAQGDLPDKMHAALVERSLGGRIVGVIARDATEIEAREKPTPKEADDNKDDPPPDGAQPPRKRGRPRKDEQRPKPEPTRLERQTSQTVDRVQHALKAEWEQEVERMKFIHMPDPDDAIYTFLTMVERVNARLKDEFGARVLRVRGAIKVKCHLMLGILALAAALLQSSGAGRTKAPEWFGELFRPLRGRSARREIGLSQPGQRRRDRRRARRCGPRLGCHARY